MNYDLCNCAPHFSFLADFYPSLLYLPTYLTTYAQPIKWRKIFLSLSFMGIVNALAYGIGKAWIALKYPTLDLPVSIPTFLPTSLPIYPYIHLLARFHLEQTFVLEIRLTYYPRLLFITIA